MSPITFKNLLYFLAFEKLYKINQYVFKNTKNKEIRKTIYN